MIKKQLGLLKFILYFLVYWVFYLCFNKDKKTGRLIMKERLNNLHYNYVKKYWFDEFKINGEINKSNKIDLIISNHISMIDIAIICAILNHFNIHNWYFVFKDSILKIPIFGSLMQDDIRLTRDWEKDKDLLETQLKNIKKGVIIIYPEGTRFTTKKHKKSVEFCYQNKLPIYNYTLAPKAKGFHSMYKILKENNTLGNIYNLTLIVPKFINRNMSFFDFETFGDIYIYIEKVYFNENDLNYENFKNKLFLIWMNKNFLIDKFTKKHIKNIK